MKLLKELNESIKNPYGSGVDRFNIFDPDTGKVIKTVKTFEDVVEFLNTKGTITKVHDDASSEWVDIEMEGGESFSIQGI